MTDYGFMRLKNAREVFLKQLHFFDIYDMHTLINFDWKRNKFVVMSLFGELPQIIYIGKGIGYIISNFFFYVIYCYVQICFIYTGASFKSLVTGFQNFIT